MPLLKPELLIVHIFSISYHFSTHNLLVIVVHNHIEYIFILDTWAKQLYKKEFFLKLKCLTLYIFNCKKGTVLVICCCAEITSKHSGLNQSTFIFVS